MEKPIPSYYHTESERLIFRSIQSTDYKFWAPFFVNNPTQKYVGADQYPFSPEAKAQNWLNIQTERKENNTYGQLAVIEKSTGNFIGVGGIIEREINGSPEFEITYSLLPSVWGNGYATELAIFFRHFAFNNIATDSVISMIHKENQASINVAIKNGMQISGETEFMNMSLYIYRISNT